MNKKIITLLLCSFFLTISHKTVDACEHVPNKLSNIIRKRNELLKNSIEKEHSEEIAQLNKKIEKLIPQVDLCFKMNNQYAEICNKQSRNQDKELKLSVWADFTRFAYAHLDNYPENKELLKKRLKIYGLGIAQRKSNGFFNYEQIANEIYEIRQLFNKSIGIDSDSIISQKNKFSESPKDTYISVRDLCDNDDHLNNWGTKTYILGILALGLAQQCSKQHWQRGEDMSSCNNIENELYTLFYNKDIQK